MKATHTKTFEQWDIDEVERTFNLKRDRTMQTMKQWTKAAIPPTTTESEILRQLQSEHIEYIDSWNEDELKFKFVAPLISLVGFNTDSFQAFTQRTLTASVDGITLTGRVDFLVATGKSKPIQPFFFLHEYKRIRGRESDPLAQVLTEMLVAQELNEHKFPIYGCHIIGRNWFFVILEERNYAESNQYSASDDGLYKIFSMLQAAKTMIIQLTVK